MKERVKASLQSVLDCIGKGQTDDETLERLATDVTDAILLSLDTSHSVLLLGRLIYMIGEKAQKDWIKNNFNVEYAQEVKSSTSKFYAFIKKKMPMIENYYPKKDSEIDFEINRTTLVLQNELDWSNFFHTVTASNIVLKPQPEQRKKNNKPKRRSGRPKETLKDRMVDDADGRKLEKVREVMNGKKGKDAALIVLACMKKGWMQKPTFTQVEKEFGDIGTQQGFTKYLNENKFTTEEIDGAVNSLDLS